MRQAFFNVQLLPVGLWLDDCTATANTTTTTTTTTTTSLQRLAGVGCA